MPFGILDLVFKCHPGFVELNAMNTFLPELLLVGYIRSRIQKFLLPLLRGPVVIAFNTQAARQAFKNSQV